MRIPEYAWYSHDANGEEITPYHENAIVILLNQGYETMEGASGDDWISGAQSMRAYMRGAEIAGIIGSVLQAPQDEDVKADARGRVRGLMSRFPLYP